MLKIMSSLNPADSSQLSVCVPINCSQMSYHVQWHVQGASPERKECVGPRTSGAPVRYLGPLASSG